MLRDRQPAVFGREQAVKPYSSPPQTSPPEELAYSFVPEPPAPPRNYAQPMWRWMLSDVGRRTVGVARVDLIRPRCALHAETCLAIVLYLLHAVPRLQMAMAVRQASCCAGNEHIFSPV